MTDKDRIQQLEDKVKTLHEEYRKQLLNLEKFRAMVMKLNQGIMVVNNDDVITKVYESFEQLTGYKEAELLGKKASDIFLKKGDVISELQMKEQLGRREAGDTSSYEIPIISKKGEELWVSISGTPLYDREGEKIGTIGIHFDITRQKRLQQALQEAREESDRAKHAEERFLAKMSHEIRTPLNAVIGMSYLLKGTQINEEQKEYVDAIARSGNLLLNLINDVLDYSKINSGQIHIRPVPMNLEILLKDMAQTFSLKLTEKPIEIHTELDIDHPAVLADETLLNQILMNLIGNAEKFTDKGSITLKAEPLAEFDNKISYQFTVEDTGSGISEDRLSAIFQEFVQEEGVVMKDAKGGTGLGLAITKKIIEMMGGKIWAESTVGIGTQMHFVIPFEITEFQEEVEKTLKIGDIEVSGDIEIDKSIRVLVAEDNSMNQKYISRILSKKGIQYEIVENGVLAQEACQKIKYDVVFMDLFMPEMDGFDSTKGIRKTDNINKETPIYALTATAVAQHKKRALTVGMDGFISKPFHPDEIHQVLQQISYHKNNENIQAMSLESNEPQEYQFNEKFDKDSLEMYYDGDIEYALEMFEIFNEQLEESLPELKESLTSGDPMSVRHFVHKLKPTFTMVGFPSTSAYFESWEQAIDKGVPMDHVKKYWEDTQGSILSINTLVEEEIEKMKVYIQRS